MNLKQLEILCKIIEKRSFSRAAGEVHLSQPTLTEHIKSLESEFNLKLLDRLGREVVPTKAGEILCRYAERIISLTNEAKQSIDRFREDLHGDLSIGASTIPGEYILPHLLFKFRRKHPRISLTVIIEDTGGIIERVLSNQAELGIVGARVASAKLDYHRFVEDELVLVLPVNFACNTEFFTLDRLQELPFILREEGSGTQIFINRIFEKFGINTKRFNVVARLGSSNAVIQAVKDGVGVSIVSKRAVEEELRRETLKFIPIKGVELLRRFYVVLRQGRTISPLSEAFMSFLLDKKFNDNKGSWER